MSRENCLAFLRIHRIIAAWAITAIILSFFLTNCKGTYDYGSSSASMIIADAAPGRLSRSLLQTTRSSNPNCTKVYTTTASDTCESLQSTQNLSQAQILELNPRLNCKTLKQGQDVCVAGISTRCNTTISVQQGPTNDTCASIAAAAQVSTEGFFVLNPGLICPEDVGSNNSWPSSGIICTSPGFGIIFIEYLGASGNNITFNDIQPLAQNFGDVVFHLALAFAIDTADNGTLRSGNFTPHWSPGLDPLSAQEFKADNPRVRFLVSIGGDPQLTDANVPWVDPPNSEDWISNAQASLTIIANDYLIDGLDINYQNIPNNSNSFAFCVGTLIQRLKGNKTIGIATIAPFGAVLQPYLNIMYGFGDLIDYVNFQFYKYQLPTAEDYIEEFNNAAFFFNPWKVLGGTEIGGNNSISGRPFISAMVQLAELRGLPGVVFFEADNSVKNNFSDETGVLTILNDPSSVLTNSSSPGPALPPGKPPSPAPSHPLSPRPAISPDVPSQPVAPPQSVQAPAPSSSPPGSLWRRTTGESKLFSGMLTFNFAIPLMTAGLMVALS